MSKKTELLSLLKSYKTSFSSANSKIEKIKGSEDYTEEGKKNEIQVLADNFNSPSQQVREKALEIMNAAEQNLHAKWGKGTINKLMDSDYQMGLSNVVKMLESDVIADKEMFKSIIGAYESDYNALALISKASENSSKAAEFISLIPKDNRQRNIKILNDLKNNISTYVNVDILLSGTGSFLGVDAAIQSLIDFIQDGFTDDFELLEERQG